MNQNDLRVKKTKKAIHNTFTELLKTKPVSKISVTELAKAAEINKATFYLHYKDIFDLYQHTLRNFLCGIADEITFMNLFFTDIVLNGILSESLCVKLKYSNFDYHRQHPISMARAMPA